MSTLSNSLNFRIARSALWLAVAVWLLMVFGLTSSVGGEEPKPESNQAAAPGLQIHRIFVPADQPSSWPTQGETYLPIDAGELAELIERASGEEAWGPYAASTLLHAVMRSDGVLEGTGLMRVEVLGGGEGWLPFPPTPAHWKEPVWLDSGKNARLGYRGSTGALGLFVTAPGRLQFRWELHPQNSAGDYKFHGPSSPVNTLILDLPEDAQCEVAPNSGTLILADREAGLPSTQEWPTELWPPPLAGTKRWLLTSPPNGQFAWQVRRSTPAVNVAGPRIEYYEKVSFEVAANGTQVVHRIDFAGPHRPTAPPAWGVPDDLVITSATWGDRPLVWTRDPATGLVLFELSEDGGEAAPEGPIEIVAWSDSKLEQDWKLPMLEPQGTYWLHGRVTVDLAPELEVRDLIGSNVRHSRGAVDGDQTELVFDKLRGNGAITLHLARRVDEPVIRVGRWIELDGVTATARMWVVFDKSSLQHLHHIQALVDEGWNIQLVMARVPYKRDDYYAPGAGSPGPRRLTVRVSSNGDSESHEPLILEIEARRTAPGMRLADFKILTVEGAQVVEDYITFEATDPNRLEYLDTPPPIPPQQLAGVLGVLLPETVSGGVFDLGKASPQSALRLGQPPASFHAHVTLQLEEERPQEWRRTGRVQIVPEQGLVDHLDLEFAAAVQQPIRWRLENETEWHEFETSGGEDEAPRRALLQLPQPTSTPLVIHLDLGSLIAESWNVDPIRVANAQAQTMECEFRTPRPSQLGVEGAGFLLLAPLETGVTEGLPLHSRWRLDPDSSEARILVERRQVVDVPPRAKIVQAELKSSYAPGTMSRHLYRMEIINQGETRFECELPAIADHVRYWRGETPDAPTHPSTPRFELPLSGAEGRVLYHIEYSLPGDQLASGRRLVAPWPQLTLPVVSSVWECKVPHDLLLRTPLPSVGERSWQARLFGILSEIELPWFFETSTPRWHAVRIPAPAQLPVEVGLVSISHRTTQSLWLLALGIIVSHFCVQRWPASTLLAAGVMAALSLLLSGVWSLFAAALSVGFWFGIVVTGLSLIVARATHSSTRVSQGSVTTTVALVMLALGLLTVAASPAAGQSSEPAQPRLESLLIPVDSQGREVGGRHYLTPRLLRELTQRRDAQDQTEAWLISSGLYQGELSVASEGKGLIPGAWTFSFEVETFRPDVAVELPLVESQGVWNGIASVDGIPLPLTWKPQGRGCQLRIAEPGRYLVRVTGTPTPVARDNVTTIVLDLPPLPEGELRLVIPAGESRVEVNRRAIPPSSELPRSHTIRLPMQRRLEVRWPQPDAGPVVADLQATELTWMEIGEEVIEVESVFHVRSAGLLPATLELRSSEPARLVTTDQASSAVGPLERQWTVEVEPIDGLPDEGEVKVHLRLAREQVLGRIGFPRFELSATNLIERKFAGSCADTLSLALDVDSPAAMAIDPLEFSYDWADRPAPIIAVQPMETGTLPVVAVRPGRDDLPAEEVVEVGCFEGSFRIEYEGVYSRSLQSRWQQSLRVTPGLVVDQVSVTVGPQRIPQPVRVSQPGPGKLVVFFSNPIDGNYRLKVAGHLPWEGEVGAARPLPVMTSFTNPPTTQRMHLFCGDQWSVSFTSPEVRPISETIAGPSNNWDAYPVGTYQLSTNRAEPLGVTLSANKRDYIARTVTTMLPAAAGWMAEITGVVEVREGNLWEVELNLVGSLLDKVEVDPPATLILAPPGEGQQRLGTLRLPKVATSGDRAIFTLRGMVRRNTHQQIEVPELQMVEASRADRLIALPPVDESTGYWENLGPRLTEAPAWLEGIAATAWRGALYRPPRGAADRPQLVSREPAAAQEELVQLMETQFWFAADQGGMIRTVATLPPLVSPELEIQLPAGQHLLWLALDQRAVVVEPGEEGYVVQLPAGARPHGLEIIARLEERVPREGTVTIASPRLLVEGRPMEIKQRLWSYDRSVGIGLTTLGGGEAMSELDQAAVRLNQLLLTSMGGAAGPDAAVEGAVGAWYEYWTAILESSRLGLEQAMSRTTVDSQTVPSDQPIEAEFNVLLERAGDRIADFQGAAPPRIGEGPPGDPWLGNDPTGKSRSWQPLVAPPGADEVTLRIAGERRGISRARWLAALGSLAVAGTLALMTRQRRPVWQHEQVLLGLILVAGAGWWLWLPLGWIGLLMAIAAGAAWLRYLRGGMRG